MGETVLSGHKGPDFQLESTDHTTNRPIIRWLDRNSYIYMAIIAVACLLAVLVSPWLILLWPAIMIADDLMMYFFGRTIFDTEEAIAKSYVTQFIFQDGTTGQGRDLGFNLYDGDLDRPLEDAQRAKWDHMIDVLGLKPGDRLIDIGCGYGDWLRYARSKGIKVTGVNLTPEQAQTARDVYGLDVITMNWKDIEANSAVRERLFGQFDAVTFMDTVEHYVHTSIMYRGDTEERDRIYTDMFTLANNLLDPASRVGRVFVSCLHWQYDWEEMNKRLPLSARFLLFTCTRSMSGGYPFTANGLTKHAEQHFSLISREEKTEDYRMTAVLDKSHFQNHSYQWSWRKTRMLALFLLSDPFFHYRILNSSIGAWMVFYGKDTLSKTYDPAYREEVSFVALYWLLFERKGV